MRYLDGDLTPHEQESFKQELLANPQLQKRLDEVQPVHTYLKGKARLEHPSKNFTQKVMEGLSSTPIRTALSYKRGLLLFVGTLLASAIALVLLSSGVFDAPTTPLVVDAPIQNELINVPSLRIPFNGKIIVNGIIFLNLGLALILLDRTILRPLFQRRAEVGY